MKRVLLNLMTVLVVVAGGVVVFAFSSFVARLPLRWIWLIAVSLGCVNLLLWQLLKRFKPRDVLAQERLEKGLCPDCGYDLAGNVSGSCPECGLRW